MAHQEAARPVAQLPLDLQLLGRRSLDRYLQYHGVAVKEAASHAEAAAACAGHLAALEVSEADVLHVFLANCQTGGGPVDAEPVKRTRATRSRANRSNATLRRGDQVAALQPGDEWILATVVRVSADHERYVLEDEDDEKTFEAGQDTIVGLTESLDGVERGDEVLAIFPDTTSFYRAFVSKAVRRGAEECSVQFVDDEDASGVTPHRRVTARFVIRMNDVAAARTAHTNLQYDDSDDEVSPSKKRQ